MSAEPRSKRPRVCEPEPKKIIEPIMKRRNIPALRVDIVLANLEHDKNVYQHILEDRIRTLVNKKPEDDKVHNESSQLCLGNCEVCLYILHEQHLKKECKDGCKFCMLNIDKGVPLYPDGFYPPLKVMKQLSNNYFFILVDIIEKCLKTHRMTVGYDSDYSDSSDSDDENCYVCDYLDHRDNIKHRKDECIHCDETGYWEYYTNETVIENLSKDDFGFMVDVCERSIKAKREH